MERKKVKPKLRALVLCEESQRITFALRCAGVEAFSCDLLPCSGGFPGWHLQMDAFEALKLFDFLDLIIMHPPCTYLAVSGNRWRSFERDCKTYDAFMFATKLFAAACSKCDHVALENPVGRLSSMWRKPNQYIQPYWFGDPVKKTTGLWLYGLPLLTPTNIVNPGIVVTKSGAVFDKWFYETSCLPANLRASARSRTFPGVANAIAEQWVPVIAGDYYGKV